MIELVAQILRLVILVVTEWFTAKKNAREATEKFDTSQLAFKIIVSRALEKMISDAKEESGQVGSVEDRMDADRKRLLGDSKDAKTQ